jgi:hypothetical protein
MTTIRRLQRFDRGLIALAGLLALSNGSRAQVLYGSVTGTVTDASGSAVPTAKVEALNVCTSIYKQVLCDDRGSYVINDLQAGIYRVTISAPSLSTFVAENVQLDADTVRRVDAQVQVAQVSISTLRWSMANWQITTWRIPPVQRCTAGWAGPLRLGLLMRRR